MQNSNNQPSKNPSLKLKKSAKIIILKTKVLNAIVNEIRDMPNYMNLKHNNELTIAVCNLVESMINNNKNKKIDKKQLVIDCILEAIPNTDTEVISSHINFIFDNNLIKSNSKIINLAKLGLKIFLQS